MTNEQVKQGFAEVYNQFWCRYKDRQPDKDSPEWDRVRTWSVLLQKKYPFLRETIIQMEIEIDRRMREKTNKEDRE